MRFNAPYIEAPCRPSTYHPQNTGLEPVVDWVWEQDHDPGNSALPFDRECRHDLPEFPLLPAVYTPEAHLKRNDNLWADTLCTQRNLRGYPGSHVRFGAPPQDSMRRRSFVESCIRAPREGHRGYLAEHRMMAAIARTYPVGSTERLTATRQILQQNGVNAAMVEKQLEDFGLLAAPDHRTRLFSIDVVGKLTGTVLQLRYGPQMSAEQAQKHVQTYRDTHIRWAQESGLLDELPQPQRHPVPNQARGVAAHALFDGGLAAMVWALPLGIVTGGLPLLMIGGMAMAAGHDMGLEYERDALASMVPPAPPPLSVEERRWAQMWLADKQLLTDAFDGNLRHQLPDGQIEAVPVTGWASGAPSSLQTFARWTPEGAGRRAALTGQWLPNG